MKRARILCSPLLGGLAVSEGPLEQVRNPRQICSPVRACPKVGLALAAGEGTLPLLLSFPPHAQPPARRRAHPYPYPLSPICSVPSAP